MKTLLVFPALLLATVSRAPINTPAFNSIHFSPFYLSEDSTFVIDTSANYLECVVYINNARYSAQEIGRYIMTSPGKYTFTYDNRYTRSTNNVFIKYRTSNNGEFVSSSYFERNIAKGKTRYINDGSEFSSSYGVAVLHSDLTWESKLINYDFEGFEDYYVPDYFHNLNLSDYKIKFDTSLTSFISCNPFLVLKNPDGAFGDIANGKDSVQFSLKLVQTEEGYSLDFKDDLYVNRKTLVMSLTPKVDYVKTKYLYFPRNGMKNQDKFDAYFSFRDFGVDKDLVIHRFKIKALRNTFGDCYNSKYCVVKEK